MIVLADETLENFFDHEFAYSFKLTEKETEQQRSLGREIFDNLLATGAKLASTTGVSRPQLRSKSTDASISTSELQATIDSIENAKLDDKDKVKKESDKDKQSVEEESKKQDHQEPQEPQTATNTTATNKHVIGDSDMSEDEDDDDEDEEEDLSPDVLEEVDRLLKEYDDENED